MARPAAAIILALAWAPHATAYSCPSFAAQEWEFTGHLVNRVYPGPPNYKSVTSGDEPIVRWYLQLAWPACFAEYRDLSRFQLALTPEEVDRYSQFLGKQIKVTGTLVEDDSGDYTTSLVLNVSRLILYSARATP